MVLEADNYSNNYQLTAILFRIYNPENYSFYLTPSCAYITTSRLAFEDSSPQHFVMIKSTQIARLDGNHLQLLT